MQVSTRRALLAGLTTLAAGTVAAAAVLRKPAGPQVLTLVAAPDVHLVGPEALVAISPPRPPAPAVFQNAAGEARSIADFAGQGLIVNLWATWCVPCVAEMPALQELARALAGEKIAVLPLSSDRGGEKIVSKFYASHDITGLPIWLDPKGEAARAWGARGLPTTLIIDRTGMERARLEGGANWAAPEMLAAIRKLVG